MKRKGKCGCRPGMGIFGVILVAVGIYFGVWGFMVQRGSVISWSMWNWNAMLLYLIGILLIGFGKMYKHKGYECCSIHKM